MVADVASLVWHELGRDPTRVAPLDLSAAERVERLWDELALFRPGLFRLQAPLLDTTALGLALRYTLQTAPQAIKELQLTALERVRLGALRAIFATWTGLQWPRFRHLVYLPEAQPLSEAWSLVTRGGVAFTFDPELGDTALYSSDAIDAHRDREGGLVPVLLHEEAHLAAALAAPGSRGPRSECGWTIWEGAAQLVQQVGLMVCINGAAPTADNLLRRLETAAPKARVLVQTLPSSSVAELVRSALAAAIDVARDPRHSPGPSISALGVAGSPPSAV